MALTEEQRDYVRIIVDLAVERVNSTQREAIAVALEQHVANCPQVGRLKYTLIGIGIGVALVSGGAGAALAKAAGVF